MHGGYNQKKNFNNGGQSKFNRGGGGGDGGKESKSSVFFPMMVETLKKLAESCDDQVLKFNDTKIEKVILLGRLVHVENAKNKVTLFVEDGTGCIPILIHKLPVEEVPELLKDVNLKENTYLRIFCSMKVANEKLFIGEQVTQVRDHNLITNHVFVCLHALLSSIKDIELDDSAKDHEDD